VITDTLPANTTFTGASVYCTESAGVVVCRMGDLAAGDTTTVLIQVRAANSVAGGTVVTNTVLASSATSDPVGSNDRFTETTTINQTSGGLVDLTIAKSDTPDPVIAGETITYTLSVVNNGPAVADDVAVID